MEERITTRIAELEQARDDFVAEANKQIWGFNAAIGELRRLLETALCVEEEPPPAPPPTPMAKEG